MDNKIIYNKTSNIDNIYKIEKYKEENYMYKILKRCFDILCSVIGIIVFSPLFILIPILIKLESKGPIVFKQLRAGKHSKPFYIYKFRSMRIDAPNLATNDFDNSNEYITKIGSFIRKTSIDEIPQLFNILKGDMSIVGPRPVILEEKELIELRRLNNVDCILPGITGWAQINGRDNIDNEEKVKYDYEYLIRRNIIMDLYIIFMTALKVINKSDIKY